MDEEHDPKETPFAIHLLAWINIAAGVILLTRALYFMGADQTDGSVLVCLAVGGIQLLVGVALSRGARWAYLVDLALVPLSVAASLWLFVETMDGATLLAPATFGLAAFALFAPQRITGRTGFQIRAWAAYHRDGRHIEPAPPHEPPAEQRLAA